MGTPVAERLAVHLVRRVAPGIGDVRMLTKIVRPLLALAAFTGVWGLVGAVLLME